MMTGYGLAKLIEECGELIQIAGKRLAYYTTDEHPDGGGPLRLRLEDEIADVLAACELVTVLHQLDAERITKRRDGKLLLFKQWHALLGNNGNGIDANSTAKP